MKQTKDHDQLTQFSPELSRTKITIALSRVGSARPAVVAAVKARANPQADPILMSYHGALGVVGDAAGAANPFSGVGISTALMTGRLAATVLDDALVTTPDTLDELGHLFVTSGRVPFLAAANVTQDTQVIRRVVEARTGDAPVTHASNRSGEPVRTGPAIRDSGEAVRTGLRKSKI